MPPPPAAVDPIELSLMVIPSDFLWIAAFMTLILVLARWRRCGRSCEYGSWRRSVTSSVAGR